MNDQEIIFIKPRPWLGKLGLGEMFRYRELLFFLALRDVKVRYKQTAIGVAWALLQPIVASVIIVVIFGTFVRFDTGAVPYPVYVLSGMLLWLFVFNAVSMSGNVFVGNVNLVTKVYFPRMLFPIASTLAGLPDLLIGMPILIGVAVWFGVSFSYSLLLAPAAIFLLFIVAASLGILFSALNVRFRDVKFALPFFLQVWMLASPIFYPVNFVPERWQAFWAINPLVGILELWRSLLFGSDVNWVVVGVSSLSTVLLLFAAVFVFRLMEDDFADIL